MYIYILNLCGIYYQQKQEVVTMPKVQIVEVYRKTITKCGHSLTFLAVQSLLITHKGTQVNTVTVPAQSLVFPLNMQLCV